MKTIDFRVFELCKKLNQIHFPAELEVIDYKAFYGCESLKNIILPSNVRRIEHDAFASCSSITEIQLSASIESLGQSAFSNCENLCFITIYSNFALNSSAFINCKKLETIHFDSSKIDTIYLTSLTSNLSFNISQANEKLTFRPEGTNSSLFNLENLTISCNIKEMIIDYSNFVKVNNFIYSGTTEISGNFSNPESISFVTLDSKYKGKLFGENVSKFNKCKSDEQKKSKSVTGAIIGISVACIVVVAIIVIVVNYILRRRKNSGLSEVLSSNTQVNNVI